MKVAEIESVKVEWQIGSEKVSPTTDKDGVATAPLSTKEPSGQIEPPSKADILSKFPVVSESESKFPTPLQKLKTPDKTPEPVKTSPPEKPSALPTPLGVTDLPEKELEAEDTVSSPIDKASPTLSSTEFQQISKPDKDSFKLDLQHQAKPKETAVDTTSSPVDVAHGEFIGTSPKKAEEESKKTEPTEVVSGEKAKVSTETASSPIDEVAPSLETDQQLTTGETIAEVVETLKTGISEATVKASEITSSICDDLKQMALKVETIAEDSATTIQKESLPSVEEIAVVTEEIEKTVVSETTETVKVSYDIKSFHTELRETHITTVDSTARDEIILHDIKEEDEEHRFSPPKETSGDKTTIPTTVQPPRPVSPREEEVAKIVANVAEVLKSEKDITEIIPDFDEKELEEKLLKSKEDDAATVQRMLVTASSEDGGEEIEICPKGSIVFTPSSTPDVLSGRVSPDGSKDLEAEIKEKDDKSLRSLPESEKSSPDIKSGPISLEEKDRIEVSEKVQMGKLPQVVSADRKESTSSLAEYPDELRRESAVSTLSEKDLTRDESTYDERPDSAASHDFGKISPEPTEQVQEIIRESLQYVTKVETKSPQTSPPKSAADDHKDPEDDLISKGDVFRTITTTTKTLTSSFIDKEREVADAAVTKPTTTTVTEETKTTTSSGDEKESKVDLHKTVVMTTTTLSSAPVKLPTADEKPSKDDEKEGKDQEEEASKSVDLFKAAVIATEIVTAVDKPSKDDKKEGKDQEEEASKSVDLFKAAVIATEIVTSTVSKDASDAHSPDSTTKDDKSPKTDVIDSTLSGEGVSEALTKTVVVTTKTVTSSTFGEKESLEDLDASSQKSFIDAQAKTETTTVTGKDLFEATSVDEALSKTVVTTTQTVSSIVSEKESKDDLHGTSDDLKDDPESTKTTTETTTVTGKDLISLQDKADESLSKTVVVTTKTVTSTVTDLDAPDAHSPDSTGKDDKSPKMESDKDVTESTVEDLSEGLSRTVVVTTKTVTSSVTEKDSSDVSDARSPDSITKDDKSPKADSEKDVTESTVEDLGEGLSKTVVVTTKTVTSFVSEKDSQEDLDASSQKSPTDSQKDEQESTKTTTETTTVTGKDLTESDGLSKTVVVTTKTVTSTVTEKDGSDASEVCSPDSKDDESIKTVMSKDITESAVTGESVGDGLSRTVVVTTKTVTSSFIEKDGPLDADADKPTTDSQKDAEDSTKTTTVEEIVGDGLSKTVVVTTKTITSGFLSKDEKDLVTSSFIEKDAPLDADADKPTTDSQKDAEGSTKTTTVEEVEGDGLSKTVVVTTKTITSGFVSKDDKDLLDGLSETVTTTTEELTSDKIHEKVDEIASKKDSSTTVLVTTKTVTSSYGHEEDEQEKIIETKESSKIEEVVKIGEKAIEKETTTTTTSLPKQSITEQVSQSQVKKEEVSKSGSIDTQVIKESVTTTEKESGQVSGTEKSSSVSSMKEDISEVSSSESRSSHTEEILTEKESSVTKSKEQKEETTGIFQESLITQKEVSVRDSAVSSTISKATTVKESVTVKSEETKESQASRVSSEIQQSSTTVVRSDSVSKSEKEESSTSVTSVTSKASEEIQVTDKQTEKTAQTKDSRRESTLSQSSDGRQTCSDHEDEDDDDADLLKIKEARSKSIATIMMTSIYKPSDESQSLSALDEEESCEVTTATIHESPKSATSSSYQTVQRTTTTAQESISGKGKRIDTTFTTSSLIDDKSPDDHMDRKTPPTAPVSPGIKSTTTSEQRDSVQHTSLTAMQYSETCGTSVPSSPKDASGKSSPGALTSESRSIPTPAGRESLTETPESSPKPTSPFPRVAKEDIQTTSTFGASEVDRTSTPELSELSEIRALEKTPLSASHEKIITTTITTVTKVISADGKEIVTEEKTITTTDTSEPDGEKVTVTTTRTTSESDKSDKVPLQPKELAMLRSEYRSSTPGSDDERPYSDDEVPASPRSVTSSQAASYDLQRSSSGVSKRSDLDIDDSQDDIPPQYGSEEHSTALSISMAHKIVDPMSTSFYGALPDSFGPLTTSSSVAEKSEPIPIRTSRTGPGKPFTDSPSQSSESDGTSQSWVIRHSGDHKFLDEADLDFEKALEEHRQVRGAEVMSSVTAKYSYSPSKSTIEETIAKPKFPLGEIQKPKSTEGPSTGAGDEEKTEKPDAKDDAKPKDPLKEWGKPLGLPSPAPIPTENDVRTTPKKERRMIAAKTKLNNEKNLRKRSESPSKTKKTSPVYVDLTYVPHNGNSYYSHVEFFKKVRARYYVFSGTEPSREVYNALLEAKQSWEDKDLEVTIIPTYDTDVLGYWVAENEELLAKYHIDLSPSASRCTINLQDHETSCSAYRLEF